MDDEDIDPHAAAAAMMADGNQDDDEAATHVDASSQMGDDVEFESKLQRSK